MPAQFGFESPIGFLLATELDGALVGLELCQGSSEPGGYAPTPLLAETSIKVLSYLRGESRDLTLPFRITGSPFQARVLQALCLIPYAQTRSYSWLAKQIGQPRAARAVGQALHKNPLLLLCPCHRVLGAKGQLTGFACGLETKRFLLHLEAAQEALPLKAEPQN